MRVRHHFHFFSAPTGGSVGKYFFLCQIQEHNPAFVLIGYSYKSPFHTNLLILIVTFSILIYNKNIFVFHKGKENVRTSDKGV